MTIPPSGNPDLDRAVAELFESARRSDRSTSRARKHHLVPASYLVRWEEAGQIRVTETDSKHTYLNRAEVAARETDFYRMESEDLDSEEIPPLLFETILGRIEGAGKPAIDRLIDCGMDALEPPDVSALSQFLAFQIARGRARRREILDMANKVMLIQYGNISDEGIRRLLRKQGKKATSEEVGSMREFIDAWKAGRYVIGPQPAARVALASLAAEATAMTLLGRRWRIYQATCPLITCDEPVVAVGGPRQDRRAILGVGTAGVVIFPLDPFHLLAMFHPGLHPGLYLDAVGLHAELLPSEVDELNLQLAAASDRWLFERSTKRRTTTLLVPPWPRDSTVFEEIRFVNEPDRAILREFRPSRWPTFGQAPPPPVERWWRHADLPGDHDRPIVWEEMEYALYNSLAA